MSVEIPTETVGEIGSLPDPTLEPRTGPKPAAHGAAVVSVFNDRDVDLDLGVDGTDEQSTAYDAMLNYWRENVGDRDHEPYVAADLDPDIIDWLPPARHDRDWCLVLTSSRWKAGTGTGDDYRSHYEYHLKLRERDDDGDLHKPPLALHVEIMPQDSDLNYKDGNELETPYGEGTRAVCWTTWAESSEEIERRLVDALVATLGADRSAVVDARNHDSRRIAKAEAHHRFKIGWKRQVIETVEQSKQLIAYGGQSELELHQQRQKEGFLSCVLDADRWHLLGFPVTDYDIELKVYQAAHWADVSPDKAAHHPKLEASFAGVNGNGALPHVDDWDEAMQTLRSVVSSHLEWSGVGRSELVADDYQPGPGAEDYQFKIPRGRRDQLRARYEALSTDIYREALKANTTAVYDILRTVAVESGATYDVLEDRTGLARSTIRYHVRRLSEIGVVDRVGSPVLVIFPSLEVLDNASEILRQIYPDDTVDDMSDRADQRRDRREQLDDQDDGEDDRADDVDDLDDQDDGDRNTWEYFDDVALTPDQLAKALDSEFVDHDHVRLRTDPYDWFGR